LDCKKQKKLYNSLLKHGIENHIFEIICECEIYELNDKERYYQDLYNSSNKFGLNIRLTKSNDRNGTFSEETKLKMSIAKIGKKRSPEVCKAISERMKITAANRSPDFYTNFNKCNKGRKHTDEHKNKNSMSKKGNTFRKGATQTEETKLKISNSKKKWHFK